MTKRSNQEFVFESLRDLGESTAKQVMAATGLSNSATTDNLRRLVAAGRVERREDFDAMAAGSGTVVLWRVLEQHEIPAGSDEPQVNPADVAEALDEIAIHQGERPPVLDPAAPIEVDDDRPQSVADAIREQDDSIVIPAAAVDAMADRAEAVTAELPAHSVDLNVTAPDEGPEGETPADGHYPTADEVDEGVAEWEANREAVDRSNYDREVQQGSETPAAPASDDPGAVLAYMQTVRPVSPAPVGEPAEPRRRRTRTSGEQRDTSGFYRRGQLSERIAEWMREHADQSYGPGDVAKALGAQTGSVGYAMDKLHAAGTLQLTQAKPKRYQARAAVAAE